MKRYLWTFLILLTLTGCKRVPEFINHPPPELSVDFSPFLDVGCPPNEYGTLICAEDSPLLALGCDRIAGPYDLLGGLTPTYPMASCFFDSYLHWDDVDDEMLFQYEDEGYIYEYGGLSPTYLRYLIVVDGEIRSIRTRDELQDTFAPIENANEALSYALAWDDLSPYYGLEYDDELRYLVDVVEDTHVTEIDRGYLVHLYYYRFYGCGPHTTSAVDVLVTNEGEVEEVQIDGVFENPEEDDLSVD